MELLNKIRTLPQYEDITKIALATLLAKQNLLLMGKPGTAKSLFVKSFFAHFDMSKYSLFASKETTEAHLFGGVKFDKLKEGEVEYNLENSLVYNELIFIDEFFDLSPYVMRELLPILNERIFFHSKQKIKTQIESVFITSNYLQENEITDAVLDRFPVKIKVNPISKSLLIDFDDKQFIAGLKRNSIKKEELEQIRKMKKPDFTNNAFQLFINGHKGSPRQMLQVKSMLEYLAIIENKKQIDEKMISKYAMYFNIDLSKYEKYKTQQKGLKILKTLEKFYKEMKESNSLNHVINMLPKLHGIIEDINQYYEKTKDKDILEKYQEIIIKIDLLKSKIMEKHMLLQDFNGYLPQETPEVSTENTEKQSEDTDIQPADNMEKTTAIKKTVSEEEDYYLDG